MMSDSPHTPVNKPNGAGLSRIFKATRCSFQGFRATWQHEAAFRQELMLVVIMFPFSFWLAQTTTQWLLMIMSLLFVIFAELINSALEALADRITLEHDELIGRAKDIGSAGVFIALTQVTVIWGTVLYLKFF
jgi:diacylglycerol kinase (ATP)